jgi:HTH-type transcriptional regulator, transcriptional repressor of NAD biosynthesis genes
MKNHFQRGLVVGKFAPLHKGHELLISRTFERCQNVYIISYCKPELPGFEPERRRHWLEQLFPAARILIPTEEMLKASDEFREVPRNEDQAVVHRRFCAFLCREIFAVHIDAVFTSEDYGDGFAAELSTCFGRPVQHLMVDRARTLAPISGEILRAALHQNRHWLSPSVYASFVKRVCLLGGESSGKSTLARVLAQRYQTCFVPEYGRELWEQRDGQLLFRDLLEIARRQIKTEEKLLLEAQRFVFCDTSPLTTLFYSEHLYGTADPELQKLAARPYDQVFLCAPDFPFVQDGTRVGNEFRLMQHEWYKRELASRMISYIELTGTVQERILKAIPRLDYLSK